jgi:hypothetical protein
MDRLGRAGALVALASTLAVMVAACGGDGGEEVASLGGGQTATTEGSSGKADADEALLAYTRCMRENGVDVPDPEPGHGGLRVFREGQRAAAADPDFEEAEEKCREHLESLGPRDMTEEQQQKFQADALAFARCMRRHGVDIPDPQFDEGGRAMLRADKIDPDDPDFRAAEEACRDLLPQLGRNP